MVGYKHRDNFRNYYQNMYQAWFAEQQMKQMQQMQQMHMQMMASGIPNNPAPGPYPASQPPLTMSSQGSAPLFLPPGPALGLPPPIFRPPPSFAPPILLPVPALPQSENSLIQDETSVSENVSS